MNINISEINGRNKYHLLVLFNSYKKILLSEIEYIENEMKDITYLTRHISGVYVESPELHRKLKLLQSDLIITEMNIAKVAYEISKDYEKL